MRGTEAKCADRSGTDGTDNVILVFYGGLLYDTCINQYTIQEKMACPICW